MSSPDSTTFTDGVTVIKSSWLNDVNNFVFNGNMPTGVIGAYTINTLIALNANISGTVNTPEIDANSSLLFRTGGLSSFAIDSSQRWINIGASQPRFQAVRITSNISTSGVVVYNSAITNIGNCYNTTTGLFTAPTAGTYTFSAGVQMTNSSGSTQIEGVYFAIAGFSSGIVPANQVSAATGTSVQLCISCTIYMNSGDTISLNSSISTSASNQVVATGPTFFTGALLY